MRSKTLLSTCIAITGLATLIPSCAPYRQNCDYCEIREMGAWADINEIYEETCIPDHPVTLEDAICIALKYNLDVRLQWLEAAVQSEVFRADQLKELGQLTAFGEVKHRNRNTGSYSQSLTAQPPAPPSISSEQDSKVAELQWMWNTLDFGIAYFQARQDADKLHIIKQRQLRARQNLVLDVTRAFYRANVARRAVSQAEGLIGTLKERQGTVRKEVSERAVSEMNGLTEQDRIIDLEIKLYAFRNEYRSALTELEGLMGIPPSCPIVLADIALEDVPELNVDICQLEMDALMYRPELIGQDFQIASDLDEIKSSILQMYPGVALFGGYNYDRNKFLLFHNWWSVGIHAAIDLLSLPSKQATVCKNWFQRWLDERTRLSMSMGVLTQVHLAFINVEETREQYRLTREMYSVKGRKHTLSEKMAEAGQMNPDDVIQYHAESLFAELEAFKAYGNLQVALEQLSNAVGRTLEFSTADIGCELWDVREPCDSRLWIDPYIGEDLGDQPLKLNINPTLENNGNNFTPPDMASVKPNVKSTASAQEGRVTGYSPNAPIFEQHSEANQAPVVSRQFTPPDMTSAKPNVKSTAPVQEARVTGHSPNIPIVEQHSEANQVPVVSLQVPPVAEKASEKTADSQPEVWPHEISTPIPQPE